MLRYLDPSEHMPKTTEYLLAVCILEGISVEEIISERLKAKLLPVLDQLSTVSLALRRELALCSLEEILWDGHAS